MKQISTLFHLPDRPKQAQAARKGPAPRPERDELLQGFMEQLQPYWDAKKYRPLTYPRLATKLAKLTLHDLKYMRSRMNDTIRTRTRDKDGKPQDSRQVAVKEFWWSINPKKHTNV
jgi:hypothetical protein